jgi:hypothetical protein
VVLMTVTPTLFAQVERVVICLVLTAAFCVLLSAAISTLFRSTATATTASYLMLLAICGLPLLVWLGRDAPFGHATVRAFLAVNPVAAALEASEMPGFTHPGYDLLPHTWWIIGTTCAVLLLFLGGRVRQLCQPE